MKHYFVQIKIVIGEYEKNTFGLVSAETTKDAEKTAILDELHNNIGEGAEWGDGGAYDDHGGMHYSVTGCREVLPKDLPVLKEYLEGISRRPVSEPQDGPCA